MRLKHFHYLILGIILFNGLGFGADARITVKGYVFDDANGDGVMNKGEVGIPSVCVSNGENVVQTDNAGRYTISVEDDSAVFVIKPRGWMTPVNDNGLPQFYYNYRPEGSPDSRYAGLSPTPPLPASVDFPLVRQDESEFEFDMLAFGDSQPYRLEEVLYFAHDVVAQAAREDVSFCVSLGDLVGDDLDLFEPLNEVMGQLGIPWYPVLGNHDTNQDAECDEHSDETYARVYGPPYYAFNWGEVHFMVLDSVAWNGPGKGYHSEFGKRQLEFIKNDLAFVPEDNLVVLLMHIPLVEAKDAPKLYKLLANYPNTFSMSGHTHWIQHIFVNEELGWQRTVPHHHYIAGATCGSWWRGHLDERGLPHTLMRDGTPNGYTRVHFSGPSYRMRYIPAARPADYQMDFWCPDTIDPATDAPVEFYVNIFAGSSRSDVVWRLNQGPWQPMKHLAKYRDPRYAWLLEWEKQLPEEAGRRLPSPVDSTHHWTATLPEKLDTGAHRIEVKSTDMFGQVDLGHRIFLVQP